MNRKPRSPQFKSQVALEALKKQLLEGLPSIFADGRAKAAQSDEALQARLYEEIGRLKVELDWLKKKAAPFR